MCIYIYIERERDRYMYIIMCVHTFCFINCVCYFSRGASVVRPPPSHRPRCHLPARLAISLLLLFLLLVSLSLSLLIISLSLLLSSLLQHCYHYRCHLPARLARAANVGMIIIHVINVIVLSLLGIIHHNIIL